MRCFWIIIALFYFALAIIHWYFGYKYDQRLKEAKEDFKKDYGFHTFGVFELIVKYFMVIKWVSIVGALLAAMAAASETIF